MLRMLSERAKRWIVFLILIVAISPWLVLAQTKIVPCDGLDCNVCSIAQLAQNLLNIGIYIAVFLSAILFAYAGWQYVTAGGESGKASEAKKIFWNVGIGLILALAAWLIVDIIMKILVSPSTPLWPWNKIC